MTRFTRLIAAAAMALLCAAAFAASDPTYTALRSAKPDGRFIPVSNFTFDRDVYHFTLNGTLHLLANVDGKPFGAIFVGTGNYVLKPATPIEQRSIAIYSGDDKLTQLADDFDRAVFFDAPLITAAGAIKEGTPNSDATSAYEDFLKRARKDFHTNYHERALQDIVDAPSDPWFFAFIRGKKYPPAILQVDALDREPTRWYTPDDTKGGRWYSSYTKAALDKGSAPVKLKQVTADHYTVDTTIVSNHEISGTTTMSFVANRVGRILPLNLAWKLRVQDAAISPAGATPSWTPVMWVQENEKEDADLAFILTDPMKAGEKYLLKVSYKGKDVLEDAGDGNYTIGARESWYPNAGVFDDVAMYDLTFRYPDGKAQIVAVGNAVESKLEGNQRVSVWKTAHPVRVAGFNYGTFKKLSQTDKESGVLVDIYTNEGEPNVIREINRILESASENMSVDEDSYIGPSHIRVNAASLAQDCFADGANTARVGKLFFGALPDNHVAITEQSQWFFGQSWPGLVYLPYVAFVDSTTRVALGIQDASLKNFIDVVGPHELAHQWWGHQVGWKTYHDQWLSEGFAEFTAGLVVQQTKGNRAYNKFYEDKRKFILEKSFRSTITNDKAGPISQGLRVSSWQAPYASQAIMYDKGAYVVHMLRMQMQDRRKPNPDQDFIDMMTDFATTYAGKNPSTEDFQRIVEKHLTPTLRMTTDGKVDWFFQQWVYGTAIPKFTTNVNITDAGGGKYHIQGTVAQSEVTNDFVSVLPMYIVFDKDKFVKIGSIPLIGNASKDINVDLPLPMKPKNFAVNLMHDVLAR